MAKAGAFWVLERKTAVKTSCGQMWEDSSGCNIRRNLVDRVRVSIGTKNPQAMRFSQGLGTSGMAGAEGLEPSARGFGVDVGERTRERVRTGVARFSRTSPKRVVLVWCCELFLGSDCASDYHFFLRKKSTSPRRMAKLTRITAG